MPVAPSSIPTRENSYSHMGLNEGAWMVIEGVLSIQGMESDNVI